MSQSLWYAGWARGLPDDLEPHVRAALGEEPDPGWTLWDDASEPAEIRAEFADVAALVREHRIWLAKIDDDPLALRVIDWPASASRGRQRGAVALAQRPACDGPHNHDAA